MQREETAERKNSSQLNAFGRPPHFAEPTPYRSAASFVREFEDFATNMFPGDPATQGRLFGSYLADMPKYWYQTTIRGTALARCPDKIYDLFKKRFSPNSMPLAVIGYRERRHRQGDETVDQYVNDMQLLLSQTDFSEDRKVDHILGGLDEDMREILRVDDPQTIMDLQKLARRAEAMGRLSAAGARGHWEAASAEMEGRIGAVTNQTRGNIQRIDAMAYGREQRPQYGIPPPPEKAPIPEKPVQFPVSKPKGLVNNSIYSPEKDREMAYGRNRSGNNYRPPSGLLPSQHQQQANK